ncbi:flavodoxin family protein [Victivallis sp. Marseille-Q1083]|uniref:flavodoxin family protein n=1 Tax=Victivallis sp. Marseille-Q1083 TaxID=2717288 RepID=UPI00158900AB|nr:flavodoxin family protein [Victivallis sp. Marseille-Q1083]
MKETIVAIVYCSRYGHTKLMAERVQRGAAAVPGTKVLLMTAQEATNRLEELDKADAIVYGTPTYMGNIASEMKAFMEAGVGRWVSRAWHDKIAGGFTNSSNFSGDKLNTLNGLMVNAMQQGMIWVGLEQLPGANEPDSAKSVDGPGPNALNRNCGSLGPMASSFNVKAPDAPPAGDLQTAEDYGKRIAVIAAQFKRGKEGD